MLPPDSTGALLTIDLDAIAKNYRLLTKRLEPAELHAVVKADAYGLGIEAIAKVLASLGCRHFFVATLEEGVALRALLANAEIGVFNGLFAGEEATYIEHRLIPCLNDLGQVELFSALLKPAMAGLQIDTGMTRLGLSANDVNRLVTEPERLSGIFLHYIFSHLACADEPSHSKNAEQLDLFRAHTRRLPPTRLSLANSSGIFLEQEYHFDFVRAGAAIYGINPQPNHPNPMTQVIGLYGRILQVRDVDTPQTVGYGATYCASGVGRIATVAVGYADGYLRTLGDRGICFVGDRQVPVIGRISMDLITIDVTEISPQQIKPNTLVELIGPHHSIDALAAEAGTIGYEILTRLGHRYHRSYIAKSA